jgi:protein-tyrosine phosphatase
MILSMKLIFIVCVSNTCRSPMGEYLLRYILEREGLSDEFQVQSRSISTDYEPENSPASPQGIEV